MSEDQPKYYFLAGDWQPRRIPDEKSSELEHKLYKDQMLTDDIDRQLREAADNRIAEFNEMNRRLASPI